MDEITDTWRQTAWSWRFTLKELNLLREILLLKTRRGWTCSLTWNFNEGFQYHLRKMQIRGNMYDLKLAVYKSVTAKNKTFTPSLRTKKKRQLRGVLAWKKNNNLAGGRGAIFILLEDWCQTARSQRSIIKFQKRKRKIKFGKQK